MTDRTGAHPGGVFTGDTLFVAGCGRFFEGTGAEMHAALSYLATLPAQTVVYDGHEYTKSNLAFAKSVDPANNALARLERLIADGVVPGERTTIGDEKEWNPFMRLDSAPIQCVDSFPSFLPSIVRLRHCGRMGADRTLCYLCSSVLQESDGRWRARGGDGCPQDTEEQLQGVRLRAVCASPVSIDPVVRAC